MQRLHRKRDLPLLMVTSLCLFAAELPLANAQGVRTANPELYPQRNRLSDEAAGRIKTLLRVEVLYEGKLGGGLSAQQWGHVFAKMGRTVRMRTPKIDEGPSIEETTRGRLRTVVAIGAIDTRGRVVFPGGKVFNRTDARALDEYLKSLETFGKQGDPVGQPMWGLNKTQFDLVYAKLQQKLVADVKGKSLSEAITLFAFPENLPVIVTAASEAWLKQEFPEQPKVRHEYNGYSKGTALAMLLNNYGLGLHPARGPNGTLELRINPLSKATQVWPIGWEPKRPGQQVAPKLYKMVPVELADVKLIDVLPIISEKTDVPIYIDYYRANGLGIDPDTLTVNLPSKRTSFSIVIRSITSPHRLTRKLKMDELGKPFLWITPFQIGKPQTR